MLCYVNVCKKQAAIILCILLWKKEICNVLSARAIHANSAIYALGEMLSVECARWYRYVHSFPQATEF